MEERFRLNKYDQEALDVIDRACWLLGANHPIVGEVIKAKARLGVLADDAYRYRLLRKPDRPFDAPHICITPPGGDEWCSVFDTFADDLIDVELAKATTPNPAAEHSPETSPGEPPTPQST